MIPDYLPDCLESYIEALAPILEPTVTMLQIVAYGGLTLCTLIAIIGAHLEDKARGP